MNALSARMASGELAPDFGPARLHPTAGAALVGARPPLVAFNVELDTEDVDVAKAIAAKVREHDGGLPGVRAIGVKLATRGVAQVSTNVQDPFSVPLADVVEAVRSEAEPLGAPSSRRRAGRPRARRGAGRFPERRRAARLRRAPPHAREPLPAVRADRLAHGQNAAKTQEAQRDTGRQRAAEPPRAAAQPRPGPPDLRAAPPGEAEQPPTWRGAIGRGALAAGALFALLVLLLDAPVGGASGSRCWRPRSTRPPST